MIDKAPALNHSTRTGRSGGSRGILRRASSIIIAIIAHALILFFAVFTIKTVIATPSESAGILKLTDLREEPRPSPVITSVYAAEAVAENVIETEDAISGEVFSEEGEEGETTDFLPMHLVSNLPKFSENEIRKRIIYPPIAQRSELEGTVYLEIFVDHHGEVRSVAILKEDPPERGFGEAAAKAFLGLKGSPALANGKEVAVRYRYPVRFTLK